jgi:hypothetical protein
MLIIRRRCRKQADLADAIRDIVNELHQLVRATRKEDWPTEQEAKQSNDPYLEEVAANLKEVDVESIQGEV